MAKVKCLDCSAIGEWGRQGRCDEHRLAMQRYKDAQPERKAQKAKYDSAHRKLREEFALAVSEGVVRCWRCLEPIKPGEDWHLGHRPIGFASHPEHPTCNLRNSNEGKTPNAH